MSKKTNHHFWFPEKSFPESEKRDVQKKISARKHNGLHQLFEKKCWNRAVRLCITGSCDYRDICCHHPRVS